MSILVYKNKIMLADGGVLRSDGGGGGSPAPTNQTVTQTNIPEYARPYVETMMGKTEALTDINQNPYQPYTGQQVAGFTPMQAQAFQNIAGQQTAGQIGEASNIASQIGQTAMGAFGQGQQLGQESMGYGGAGAQLGVQGGGLYGGMGAGLGLQAAQTGQQFGQMATDPRSQQAYMSPYMQNVVDFQKQQAIRDYDIAATGRNAQAVRAGAFGGSRQAVAEGEANRALMNQLGGIQATGTQKAFEDAQNQMRFGSQLGLQGLQTGIQGAQTGLQGVGQQLAGTSQGMQGVQGAVNAGQYGLAGLGAAGQAASTLGALGQTQFQQEMGINQAMQQAGAQQQGLQQKGLDVDYQQYMDSLNYPFKMLGFQSDQLRGLPLSQGSSTMYQAQPGFTQQAAGYGLGALGAYKAFG